MEDVKKQLNIPFAQVISESFDRPNIFYSVFSVGAVDKREHLQSYLQRYKNKATIIYGTFVAIAEMQFERRMMPSFCAISSRKSILRCQCIMVRFPCLFSLSFTRRVERKKRRSKIGFPIKLRL